MSFAITITNVSPSITINTASICSVAVTNKSTPISIKRDGTGPKGDKGDTGQSITGPKGDKGDTGLTGLGAAWGSMTGSIAAQSDLATALAAKGNLATANTWTGDQTYSSAGGININLKAAGGAQVGLLQLDVAGRLVIRTNAAGSQMYLDSASFNFRNFSAGTTCATISGTGDAVFSGKLTATNKTDGVSISVRGKSTNGDRYAWGKAPYAFIATTARCSAEASVAATSSTVYTLKKRTSGTTSTIGTFTFAASATTATVSISAGSIASGDFIFIDCPIADATLSDIGFFVSS